MLQVQIRKTFPDDGNDVCIFNGIQRRNRNVFFGDDFANECAQPPRKRSAVCAQNAIRGTFFCLGNAERDC